ncbi:Cell 12A endoglucanase [Phytophthora cinnamomi]|nr:Cell 12A endoglucanase [Phytophthora cinnamomi]
MNKQVKVFTYVAKTQATSFSADLKEFFNHLPANNTLPQTQYLQKLEAGTEPFQGKNAKLVVSSYSAQVN